MEYGKALVAVLVAGVVVAYQALGGDGRIEPVEWVSIAIAVTTAIGVYLVPLAPRAKWTKTAVAGLLAVLQVVSSAVLEGGLTTDMILLAIITVAGAVGIYVAPATSVSDGGPVVSVGVGPDV